MLRMSGLVDLVDHAGGIEVAPFATTHTSFRQEIRIVSNLMAQFGRRGSSSDRHSIGGGPKGPLEFSGSNPSTSANHFGDLRRKAVSGE